MVLSLYIGHVRRLLINEVSYSSLFTPVTHRYDGITQFYWGCKYNNVTDRPKQNLSAPLRKDSFQIWQRSWAVLRFRADAPGIWQVRRVVIID